MIRCARAVEEWTIDPRLAARLEVMAEYFTQATGRDLSIISGFRTKKAQDQLRQEGRPAAPDDLSTHRVCPATGADLRMDGFPSTSLKAVFGEAAVRAGLRWGGGSAVDPSTGIPSDWNHVDLGPRGST